ncbi:3-hydroxyisobutyryl-CoA hydrolase 1-like [Bidens hawaiensis]|uniref:3-hydroxyisobutyryl-CoA hydrolase 1-like n=1 Tax=Bidens hawaiensis TaxID=980011 RepID=UPI00404A1EE0
MALTSQVLVRQSSNARTIILNRPEKLNVLSLEMESQLLELFRAYEEDPGVKLIIMKGEGRAFCAGGDIAAYVNGINTSYYLLDDALEHPQPTRLQTATSAPHQISNSIQAPHQISNSI